MDDKELEKYFGKMIRTKRTEKKITQEQLAELVGISTTYLRGVEHGDHSITWKIWLSICVALGLDISELIDKMRLDNRHINS